MLDGRILSLAVSMNQRFSGSKRFNLTCIHAKLLSYLPQLGLLLPASVKLPLAAQQFHQERFNSSGESQMFPGATRLEHQPSHG